MKRSILAILTSGLLLASVPVVLGDETKADCEEDQPLIGYTNNNVNSTFVALNNTSPVKMFVCEGEHWDGQDSVRDDAARDEVPCANEPQATATDIHFSFCQGSGHGRDGLEEYADAVAGKVVTFRVSSNREDRRSETYVALNIYSVGVAVVYLGQCEEGASRGLEGAEQCEGRRQGRNAVYVEDATPSNVLAIVVSSAGITQGYVRNGDCDHRTYQDNAYARDRTKCGRDNTAITHQWLLP